LTSLTVIFFVVIIYGVKKNIINIGDPLFQLVFYSSTAISTLILIEPSSQNGEYAKNFFIASYIIIFLIIGLIPTRISAYSSKLTPILINSSDIKFLFILSFITGFIIMINFIDSGMGYEERAILFSKFRVIEILRGGSTALLAFSLGFMYSNKNIIKWILPIIIINFFSGSKGYLIVIMANFIMGRAISSNYKLNLFKLLFILFFGYISIYILFEIQSRENINVNIFYRFLASGDIYFHGLEELDIDSLDGFYNIFTYIVHPITSLFGYRMYEYSLGNEIQGQLSGNYSLGGTNAGFIYLSYISFKEKYYVFIFSISWALLLVISRVAARKLILKLCIQKNLKYNIIYIAIIYNLLTIPIIFFLDVGVGVQQFLGGFIILCTLLFFKIININVKR
jgi:hypothetical protein